MNPHPPPPVQWTPPPAEPRRPASSGRIAIALVLIGLIAVAALVVGSIALTRPASSSANKASTAPATPTFTPDQVASAKKDFCSAYQLAAHSVKADTNSADTAIARISLTNAAGILDAAANNPALNNADRDSARKLAAAYRTIDAVSSVFDKTSSVFEQSVDEANQADAAMAAVCP
jgi:hypothetical protein